MQRRLCPIFVSGVGLPFTSIPRVDGLSTDTPDFGRHMQNNLQPIFSIISAKGEMNLPNPLSPINPLSIVLSFTF